MGGVIMTNRDVELAMELEEFRLWAEGGDVRMGYPSSSTFARRIGRTPQISDDHAQALEEALLVVRSASEQDYLILHMAYVRSYEDARIGEVIRKSASRVTTLRGGALKAWYCAWLAGFKKVA